MAISPTAWALEKSADRQGIDARILQKPPYNLTGKDVFIGQVELSRPTSFAVDKIFNKLLQLDRAIVQPYAVFFRDGKAIPNRNIDDHSAQVAAVIVSQHKIRRGIAPDAKLLSSAYSQRRQDGQPEACLAAQYIARQYNSTVRAINFSFGELLSKIHAPMLNLMARLYSHSVWIGSPILITLCRSLQAIKVKAVSPFPPIYITVL